MDENKTIKNATTRNAIYLFGLEINIPGVLKNIGIISLCTISGIIGHRIGYSEGKTDELIRLAKINDVLHF